MKKPCDNSLGIGAPGTPPGSATALPGRKEKPFAGAAESPFMTLYVVQVVRMGASFDSVLIVRALVLVEVIVNECQ